MVEILGTEFVLVFSTFAVSFLSKKKVGCFSHKKRLFHGKGQTFQFAWTDVSDNKDRCFFHGRRMLRNTKTVVSTSTTET
jgi:hypothetical protein